MNHYSQALYIGHVRPEPAHLSWTCPDCSETVTNPLPITGYSHLCNVSRCVVMFRPANG